MSDKNLPLSSVIYAFAAIGLYSFAANWTAVQYIWVKDALTIVAVYLAIRAFVEDGTWTADRMAGVLEHTMEALAITKHLRLYQAARGLTVEQLEAIKDLRIEGDILAWKENDRGEWAQNIQTEGGLVPLELAQRIIANSSDHHVSGERYVDTGEREMWRWFVARMHYKGYCEEPGAPGKLTRWMTGGRAAAAKWIGLGKVAPADEDDEEETTVRSFTTGSMQS